MTKAWEKSEELIIRILDRLADGESLRQICADPDMPSRHTVMNWQDDDPSFSTRCARAREWQADLMDDKILATAEKCTPETAPADKVKISAYQWRASKLAPKKYGDKIQQEHSGPDGGAIPVTVIQRKIIHPEVE